jgi:hypothetical protein
MAPIILHTLQSILRAFVYLEIPFKMHKDRQTKITVWELAHSGSRFRIPGWEKGTFSGRSLKVEMSNEMGEQA